MVGALHPARHPTNHNPDSPHSWSTLDEEAALRAVLEGTATTTGERFFAALVQHLATVLGTAGAWVTEYLESARRLRALAFWLEGRWVDDYEYDIDGTPCEPVVREARLVLVPENVIALYPRDADLPRMRAVSYMGAPLTDVDGRILGHLAVLDTRPMPAAPTGVALFRIFAARATAELQRLRAEQQVREREEKLRRFVDSAMDAVIEIDAERHVTRLNPAAERIFRCSSDATVGAPFARFLSDAAAAKLTALIGDLQRRPPDDRSLWIPGGLEARTGDGSPFLAEATLCGFEVGRRVYHALILRNVDERLEAERRIRTLTAETERLRDELAALGGEAELLGESPALRRVLQDIAQVADTEATVLIVGETGTGKELIARAVHAASRRRDRPLVTVNCAAIPAALVESEFFGHEAGAFTGALRRRDGRFALADGGTIFLDEVGELPLELQAKLLRVLQEGTFEVVGSSQTRRVDVRVVAATNRDLGRAVREGTFREDLYYRLNVFPITVPPLRERREDIAPLAAAFAARSAQRLGRRLEPLTTADTAHLNAYDWPGNARELQNVIERAVITAEGGRLNLARALPHAAAVRVAAPSTPPPAVSGAVRTARELEEIERANLRLALEQSGGRIAGPQGAAALLGMKPSTLSSRLKALGLRRDKPERPPP